MRTRIKSLTFGSDVEAGRYLGEKLDDVYEMIEEAALRCKTPSDEDSCFGAH